MRPHRLLLLLSSCAAMTFFSAAVQGAEPREPTQPAQRAAPAVSPFLEFSAAGTGPRASSRSADSPTRKPFEMAITTPVTNFGHMRRGPSNAMLECIIPADLRRD